MLKLTHIGAVAIAAIFVTALAIDAADARRGGGGGGRGGGGFSRGGGGGFGGGGMRAGGGMRVQGGGGRGFANAGRPSHPIAGRPGAGGGWAGRPGYGGGGWGGGYRPGYGWGAAAAGAAIGTGLAYSGYSDPYGSYGYYDQQASYVQPDYGAQSDPIAECARRFKTYDPASQTYIKSKGVRASCP
jgi:hypothetical protein